MIINRVTGETVSVINCDLSNGHNYLISPQRVGTVRCRNNGVRDRYVTLTETLGLQKNVSLVDRMSRIHGNDFMRLWNRMVTTICMNNGEEIEREFRNRIHSVIFDDIGEVNMDDLEIRIRPNNGVIKRVYIDVRLR